MAATINVSSYLNENKIRAIFNQFDIDNTGEITRENLKVAFSKFGRDLSDDEIKHIMKAHDLDKGNTICFEEFEHMLTGGSH